MDSILQDIKQAVISGVSEGEVVKLVIAATDKGYKGDKVINEGLIAGIDTIGKMWKEGEAFIPEVVRAAEVMRAAISAIGDELMIYHNTAPLGTVVIGTVEGDVHDIGKSLVRMMMEAREAEIVCMSALLTTTMTQMEHTIKALKDAGSKVKTMVGGSPVTKEYADKIGADGYAPDAVLAVDKAKELLETAERRGT